VEIKRESMPAGAGSLRLARRRGGEAANAAGRKAVSRLQTPEGYTLTAMTSLEIVRRVLAGEATHGFQTPSRIFGPDFITTFKGCLLENRTV